MIECQDIEGRKAIIAYLTSNLEPAEKEDATLIKITFDDDQSSFWLTPQEHERDGAKE